MDLDYVLLKIRPRLTSLVGIGASVGVVVSVRATLVSASLADNHPPWVLYSCDTEAGVAGASFGDCDEPFAIPVFGYR